MPTIAHTEVCEDRDFAEWHQGRPWCGVWVVRAEAPRVQALVQVARSALRPGCCHAMHASRISRWPTVG